MRLKPILCLCVFFEDESLNFMLVCFRALLGQIEDLSIHCGYGLAWDSDKGEFLPDPQGCTEIVKLGKYASWWFQSCSGSSKHKPLTLNYCLQEREVSTKSSADLDLYHAQSVGRPAVHSDSTTSTVTSFCAPTTLAQMLGKVKIWFTSALLDILHS